MNESGEPVYAKCYVCGVPMDGKSEDDCHCFHRTETLQHIEHVEFWADAYTNPAKDDEQFCGHPIAAKLLTEYAALLRSLAVLPLPAVVQAAPGDVHPAAS